MSVRLVAAGLRSPWLKLTPLSCSAFPLRPAPPRLSIERGRFSSSRAPAALPPSHAHTHSTPPPSPFVALARRAFSVSPTRILAMRPSYYTRGGSGGNSYGRGSGNRGPWGTLKDRIDRLPAMWVLGAVCGLNVAVFGAWNYGAEVYSKFRDPSWMIFLRKNFTTSWANFSSGRVCVLPRSKVRDGALISGEQQVDARDLMLQPRRNRPHRHEHAIALLHGGPSHDRLGEHGLPCALSLCGS